MLPSNYAGAAYSLAAAACWGAGDFNGGLGSKGSNAFGVVIVAHGTGLACMLALAALTHEAMPSAMAMIWGAVAGVTGGLGLAALYRALAIGPMGVNAPVAAVINAALPVAISFRNEGLPSTLQFAGFVVAFIAIWMIAMPSGELGRPRGLGLAILAGIGFSGFLVFSKVATANALYWPLAAARASSILTMFMVVLLGRAQWKPNPSLVKFMMLAGTLDAVGNALYAVATHHDSMAIAAVLSSLYPASTVVLSRVLLKERLSGIQTAGMAAALVAVPLIAGR